MSQYNATAIIVDDQDPRVKYSSGWTKADNMTHEYLFTQSGTREQGATAAFEFVGTGVEVYGSMGSIDVYGRPVSTYVLDGLAVNIVTYQAPIIKPGYFLPQFLYYRSPPLPPGTHQLVITNLNGTAPSVYWLDYLLYTPSDETSSSSSSSSAPSTAVNPAPSTILSDSLPSPNSAGSIGPTTSVASSSVPTAGASISPSLTGTSASSAASSPAGTSPASHNVPVGTIAGATVGGVLAVVIVVALLWYCRRRRPRHTDRPPSPTPFGSWRDTDPSSATRSEDKLHSWNTAMSMSGGPVLTHSTPSLFAGRSTLPHDGPNALGASPWAAPALHGAVNWQPLSSAIEPSSRVNQIPPPAVSVAETSDRPRFGYEPGMSAPVSGAVIIHEDSGARFESLPLDVTELPPVYTQE